jgi:hypothetical protein
MNSFRRTTVLLGFIAQLLGCGGSDTEKPAPTERDEAGADEPPPDARTPDARADAKAPNEPKPQDAAMASRADAAARDAASTPLDAGEPSPVADGAPDPLVDAAPESVADGSAPATVDAAASDGGSAARDAGRDMLPPRGMPGRCTLPSSCRTVTTLIFDLRACCLSENVCGYDLVRPPELREAFFGPLADGSPIAEGTCVPADRVFRAAPGESEERVAVEGSPDILVTPGCDSRILGGFSLPGCCMTNNQCGVSTHHTADTLGVLVVGLSPPGFTKVQCMPVDTLNMQLRQTNLAGFGQLPLSNQRCDFQALDAMLPPNP